MHLLKSCWFLIRCNDKTVKSRWLWNESCSNTVSRYPVTKVNSILRLSFENVPNVYLNLFQLNLVLLTQPSNCIFSLWPLPFHFTRWDKGSHDVVEFFNVVFRNSSVLINVSSFVKYVDLRLVLYNFLHSRIICYWNIILKHCRSYRSMTSIFFI